MPLLVISSSFGRFTPRPSTATTIARTSAITASAFFPSQLVKRVMVGWHPVLVGVLVGAGDVQGTRGLVPVNGMVGAVIVTTASGPRKSHAGKGFVDLRNRVCFR